jgi:hypothetical protein
MRLRLHPFHARGQATDFPFHENARKPNARFSSICLSQGAFMRKASFLKMA